MSDKLMSTICFHRVQAPTGPTAYWISLAEKSFENWGLEINASSGQSKIGLYSRMRKRLTNSVDLEPSFFSNPHSQLHQHPLETSSASVHITNGLLILSCLEEIASPLDLLKLALSTSFEIESGYGFKMSRMLGPVWYCTGISYGAHNSRTVREETGKWQNALVLGETKGRLRDLYPLNIFRQRTISVDGEWLEEWALHSDFPKVNILPEHRICVWEVNEEEGRAKLREILATKNLIVALRPWSKGAAYK